MTTARNDSKYQVPVFKAIYKMDAVILWQVDVGFDERYYDNFQVLKGKPLRGEIFNGQDITWSFSVEDRHPPRGTY